jgi:hypothetical protein
MTAARFDAQMSQVAARPGETRDQAKPDRVLGDREDDRDRRFERRGGDCVTQLLDQHLLGNTGDRPFQFGEP